MLLETHNVVLNRRLGEFISLSYEFDRARFKEYEMNDPWVHHFVHSVKELLKLYQVRFEEFCYRLVCWFSPADPPGPHLKRILGPLVTRGQG